MQFWKMGCGDVGLVRDTIYFSAIKKMILQYEAEEKEKFV